MPTPTSVPTRDVQVTFDAADPLALGTFWAEALGYVMAPPPGEAVDPTATHEAVIARWMDFLERTGVPEEDRNRACAIVDPRGQGPRIFLQRVSEPKAAKNRVHLDVRAAPGLDGEDRMAALERECERLVALGATRQQRFEPGAPMSAGHLVLRDPEGNEFCLD